MLTNDFKNTIPIVPSLLELLILQYSNYCEVCNLIPIKDNHKKIDCIKCNKVLCFSHIEGIYELTKPKINNQINYICEKCRRNIKTPPLGTLLFTHRNCKNNLN